MRRRRRYPYPTIPTPATRPYPADPPITAPLVEEFPTWGEFVSYVTTPGKHSPLNTHAADNPPHESWDMQVGWDGAVKLALEGWPEGTAALVALSSRFTGAIASRIERFDPYYDLEAGGNLDVARYLDGEPECWLKLESVVTQRQGLKHITVVYSNAASCGIHADSILARGAAMASLIECLEFAGHRIRLVMAMPIDSFLEGRAGNLHASLLVTVKEFDQPLDAARMVYAIAHPATFRRLGFAWMERLPHNYQQAFGGGYGYVGNVPPEHRGDIYLTGMLAGGEEGVDWNDPGAAEAWVITKLKEQGVVLSEEIEER